MSYPIGLNVFNTQIQKETQARGFQFKFGTQIDFAINYRKNSRDSITDTIPEPDVVKFRCKNELIQLNNPIHISLGYTYSPVAKLAAKYSTLAYNYTLGANEFVVIKDTTLNTSQVASEIVMPLANVIGLQFKYGDKLTLLTDFGMENWSKFKLVNTTSTLKNAMSVGLGLQWVPNRKVGNGEYLKRVNYRAGVKYSDGYLELQSTKISSLTIAGGFGFPVGKGATRNMSMFNIGFEYIKVGSTKNNLVQENHYKATIGLTINDRWFKKYVLD